LIVTVNPKLCDTNKKGKRKKEEGRRKKELTIRNEQ
jgi:hypothetical protein